MAPRAVFRAWCSFIFHNDEDFNDGGGSISGSSVGGGGGGYGGSVLGSVGIENDEDGGESDDSSGNLVRKRIVNYGNEERSDE